MNDYEFKINDYLIAKTNFTISSTGITWYFVQGRTYKVIDFHYLSYTNKKGIGIMFGGARIGINSTHLKDFDTIKIQRRNKIKKLNEINANTK